MRDLVRRGDRVYCRRCRTHQLEITGAWMRCTMRNGVVIRQFICQKCNELRDKAINEVTKNGK